MIAEELAGLPTVAQGGSATVAVPRDDLIALAQAALRAAGGQEKPPLSPKYPKGTPEYDAYRAELTAELARWSGGQSEPSDAPEFTAREIGLMELGMSELRRQRGDVPWDPEHAAEMRALQLRLQSWQAATAAVSGEQA